MSDVPGERGQRLQPIHSRGPEADRARILVVLADGGHLADLEPEGRRLDEDLRVEDEVIAVFEKWDRLEEAARVGAVAGVKLGQVKAKDAIFGGGQETIADALPPRHACFCRVQAEPS